MSTGTWSGRVYVDGVAVTALHTDSQSAETTGGLFCGGTTNGQHTYFAQIIAYDDTADAGQTPTLSQESIPWLIRELQEHGPRHQEITIPL